MISLQTNTLEQQKRIVYFPNLDGLRFFAFLFVFLNHCFYTDNQSILSLEIYKNVQGFFHKGHLGVNFFFVLSGFLITYLLLVEEETNGKVNIPFFYMRRVLRIWPLYYACLLYGFVIYPKIKLLFGMLPEETANPLMFITFLANYNQLLNGSPDSYVLAVLWSVSVEEQFYLMWPLLLVLFRKNKPVLFVLILALSTVFRMYYAHDAAIIFFHTMSVITDLALGGLLGWLAFSSKEFISRIEHVTRKQIIAVYVAGILLLAFDKYILISPYGHIVKTVITSLFFAFIIAEQNFARNSFYKIGRNKFVTKWGRYTFGLYCLHFIGLNAALQVSKKLHLHDTIFGLMVFEVALALLISMVLSWVSYHYYEKYFLAFKDKFAYINHKPKNLINR